MIFATLNIIAQSNEQNATNASVLNIGGGNQAIVQGASNNATVATVNTAVGNLVLNAF